MSKAEEKSDDPGANGNGGEQSLDGERTSKPDLAPPPSVVIEPKLSALADDAKNHDDVAPVENALETPAAGATNVADRAYAAFETPELSPEDAERYAAQYRASWEPASPVPVAITAAERMRSANPAAVALPDPELVHAAAGAFPGAAQRKRGMLIATSAIVGFFALVALSFAMGTRGLPSARRAAPSAEHTEVAAPTPAPAAPTIEQPTPAPPAPAPTPAPAPAEAKPEVAVTDSAGTTTPSATPATSVQAVAATETAPSAAPAAAVAPTAANEAVAAALVAGAEVAENRQPSTVQVDIAASPAGAHLTVDGERVTNPFEMRAPKGGRHRVLAEAPGHRPRDLTLDFKRDQHLDIKLERVGSRKRPSAAARPLPTSSTAPRKSQPTAPSSQPKGAGFVSESPY